MDNVRVCDKMISAMFNNVTCKHLMIFFPRRSNFIACDVNNHTAPGTCMTQPLKSGES